MGYQTVVFENLDKAPFGFNYIMTVVFPNWESRVPDIEEIGYLTYNQVIAGEDSWYDPHSGNKIPYNYSNNIFIRFVKKVDNSIKDIII